MVEERLTPPEAASVLLSHIFTISYFSESVIEKLGGYLFDPETAAQWNDLFRDTQRSQLLVDTVKRVLETRTSDVIRHNLLLTQEQDDELRLRFGLKDGLLRTLDETGKEMGVTRIKARQIEARALRKLRNPYQSRNFREFVPESFFNS